MMIWIIVLLLIILTWVLFGSDISAKINRVSRSGQDLLYECEKDICLMFLENFPDIPKSTTEEQQLKHLSLIFTIILSNIAYKTDDSSQTKQQRKQLFHAQYGFIQGYLHDMNKLITPQRIREEFDYIDKLYPSHEWLFLQCLEHLDYHTDLDLTAKTSFQNLGIDERLRKLTRNDENFFQIQCQLYTTFLTDYIRENHQIEFYVKKLFVHEDYHSAELTNEGKSQAFYFFEVCYEVFLDILRYRLNH